MIECHEIIDFLLFIFILLSIIKIISFFSYFTSFFFNSKYHHHISTYILTQSILFNLIFFAFSFLYSSTPCVYLFNLLHLNIFMTMIWPILYALCTKYISKEKAINGLSLMTFQILACMYHY